MLQCQPELLRGLAVRAEAGGAGGGERGVPQHRGTVAAARGVVRQPPVVMRAPRGQARERPCVGTGPLSRGQ
jgi:hypothetical protein